MLQIVQVHERSGSNSLSNTLSMRIGRAVYIGAQGKETLGCLHVHYDVLRWLQNSLECRARFVTVAYTEGS
jgi:hypothetical protein